FYAPDPAECAENNRESLGSTRHAACPWVGRLMPFVFHDAPQRVYWELTRACDLSCTHCRANAIPVRDSRELTTRQICNALEAFAKESTPHVILTGGDPLKRHDFFTIITPTIGLGLPCLVAPSAQPLLTHDT